MKLVGPVVVACVACGSHGSDRTVEQQVDAIVASVATPDGPGIAIGIVRDGHVVLAKGYGLADLASRQPITTGSVFDLASLGKQFTGAALLLLVERGSLSMDDDARRYLPELPALDRDRPIRVRDLSSHTSGLPEFQPAPGRVATDADALAWVSRVDRLETPTGSRWRYRNINYVLLARIVERVARRRFATFVQEELFTRAGMRTAQLLGAPDGMIAGRVTGYCLDKQPCRRDGADTGAANVFASLDDLIAWDAAWTRGALPAAALERELAAARLDSGARVGYALGWSVASHRGHEYLWHDGDWLGASTYIARYVDAKVTIVVLSNQARRQVDEVARRIADVLIS